MDNLKQQHLAYIRTNPFEFTVTRHGFTEDEIAFLEKYGHWMEALKTGVLEPITDCQKEVVEELTTNIFWSKCKTEAFIWKKYKRREWEDQTDPHIKDGPPISLKDDPSGSREDFQKLRKRRY